MAGPLIGALRVSLSAETAAFEAGMKRAQRTTATAATGMSKSLGLVKTGLASFAGALSIGLIASAIKSSLEYAGSLGELASTLGLTTRDLQEFSFAAGQVGISQEELQVGIQKLTISMGKAQLGSEAQIKAFNAIGISIDQLKGKDAGQVFRLIAEKLETVSDRSKRAAVEVALFGKAGAKLDNLLSGAEGGLNALTDAAEKLGIVLSDEQIRKADQTADKLEALKTVLKANIAGVVADNADAILELANALTQLVAVLARVVGMLSQAGSAFSRFAQNMPDWASTIRNALFPLMGVADVIAGLQGKGSSSVTMKLPPARPVGGVKTGSIGQFLAPGGGRAKKDHSAEDAERKRLEALRKAHDFDEEMRRAQIDILNAQKDLATDYSDRATISIQILDLERQGYQTQLQYEVATKDKTQAQAAQLMALYDSKDALERQAVLDEEETKRAEDFQDLLQHDFDRQREILEARAGLAETASERRKIELELLRIAYEQKRQALQNVIDTSKDFKEIEDARRDLANLNATEPLAKQGVNQATRGPMEDWLASLPTTAAKAQEALERLEVEGFDGLIDSVLALSEGVGAATDSLLATLKQFLLGLARMELQKMLGSTLQSSGGLSGIIGAIGGIFGGGVTPGGAASLGAHSLGGGLPGFATGGSGIFRGIPGMDRNVVSINGVPQFRVSAGERFSIGNDNHPSARGHGNTYMTINTPDADSFRRSQGQITRAWQRRLR